MQNLNRGNANDFGLITAPPRGVRVADTSLLTDGLTLPPNDWSFVGLPAGGAQLGTFRVESGDPGSVVTTYLSKPPAEAGQAPGPGRERSIQQVGTFPWLREGADAAFAVNDPAGLAAEEFLFTEDAAVTAHSLEFAQTGTGDAGGLQISKSTLKASGGPVSDPFVAGAFTADTRGRPLGYAHFLSKGGAAVLKGNSVEALLDIRLDAPGGVRVEEGGALRSGQGSCVFNGLTGTGALLLDSVNVTALSGEVRAQGFDSFTLDGTMLDAGAVRLLGSGASPARSIVRGSTVTASSSAGAKIYANGTLVFEGTSSVSRGRIAAPVVEVAAGAELDLTGPEAVVYANLHNYGRPGFGTLRVNGVVQSGANKPQNLRLRPAF